MRNKVVVITIGIGLVAATLLVWQYGQKPEKGPVQSQLARVTRGSLVERASASGTVQPDIQVEVKSRASGEVIELAVAPGDQVQAGKLLVRLDPTDEERSVREARASYAAVRARLAQAKASLAVAQAEAKEADAKFTVRQQGLEKGIVSAEENRSAKHAAEVAHNNIALREADILSAKSEIERAQLAIDEANRRLEETTIRAPITGTVLSVLVEKGTIISSGITNVGGGTTLLTVADLSRLYVVGDLDEAQVGKVQPQQNVEIHVDAYPDRVFRGRVESISPLGKETSNIVTFDVKVIVTDKDTHLLRSGMKADLEIITSDLKNALLVPIMAIGSEGRHRYVVLASGERRPVETGTTDGSRIAVLNGLAEGDEVMVTTQAKSSPAGFRPGLFGPRKGK